MESNSSLTFSKLAVTAFSWAKIVRLDGRFYIVYGTYTVPFKQMMANFLTQGQYKLVKFPTQERHFYVKLRGCARFPLLPSPGA